MVGGVARLEGVTSQGDEFGEGGRNRGREGGGSAHGTGSMEAEPGINALDMKTMKAIRKQTKKLTISIIS